MDTALKQRIDALQTELHSYYPLPEEIQDKIDKKFRLEFNYNSNHIEGNTLTYGETELFLFFDEIKGGHTGREYEEMRASDVALKLIAEQAKNKEQPLTETFIKQLNSTILVRPYWKDAITADGQSTQREITVGDYKKFPNSVRLQNGEIFHYSSPFETPAQMTDLVSWFREEMEKAELHPVELAALLHYRFVRIHPFDDGNGRISRLLMNYVLLYNDFPPVVIKSADKRNYLAALHNADVGDLDSFVNYVAEQLVWSLELSITAARGESIEEIDDVEKEIELYKREVAGQIDTLKKTGELVTNLYQESIKPLFNLYKNKFASSFGDLFNSFQINEFEDDAIINIEASKNRLKELEGTSGIVNNTNVTINYNVVHILGIHFFLSGFKKAKTPFDISSQIRIFLNEYNYQILIDSKIICEKLYSEQLKEDEKINIVNTCLRQTFALIKIL